VKRARVLIDNLGLEIAKPYEARQILDLKGAGNVAF